MRLIQLSDIHVWRWARRPSQFFSKRSLGLLELATGRASRFRLERLDAVIERVRGLDADHLLVTGDLTTTALPSEFRAAREALDPLLGDAARATIIPGNHDRYTTGSVRRREFEATFGMFAPRLDYPWLREIGEGTAILGLDPTRSHLNARGYLPDAQLDEARSLFAELSARPRRLIVACHYPLVAPPPYESQLRAKKLANDAGLYEWVSTLGPHLYCCGHVHAAWAFVPPGLPRELCINSGAPLLRDPTGLNLPGFMQIDLDGDGVIATHHAWDGSGWLTVPKFAHPGLFGPG